MTARNRNIVVGLVTLGAILTLAWMILQFSGRSFATVFAHSTPLTIVADRADGVGEGSQLLYLGVPVGQVISVKRLPSNREVQIECVLNEGEAIPENVEGFIRPQSALGTAAAVTLEVKRGQKEPSANPIKPNAQLRAYNQNGGLIPPEFTDIAKSIQEQKLVAHLDETVLELKAQLRRAGESMDSFNKLVGDPKLREDLSAAMASVRSTSENLDKFSKRLDGLAGETEGTLKDVRSTLAGGSKHFDDLSKQAGDRLVQLGDVLDKVNAITARVEKGQGTLGLLVNDPKLYESLVDTSKTLNLTVGDLRRLVEQWEQEGFTLKLK